MAKQVTGKAEQTCIGKAHLYIMPASCDLRWFYCFISVPTLRAISGCIHLHVRFSVLKRHRAYLIMMINLKSGQGLVIIYIAFMGRNY